MATIFSNIFMLPGPVAAQDKALHLAFVQALADSGLLEHTCKAAPRLAQVWEPHTLNCLAAAAAPAARAAAGANSSGSGGVVIARPRPEALRCAGIDLASPHNVRILWSQTAKLVLALETVRAETLPLPGARRVGLTWQGWARALGDGGTGRSAWTCKRPTRRLQPPCFCLSCLCM